MEHWSAFRTEVEEKSLTRGPECGVGRMLRSLHSEARTEVENALNDWSLPTTAIHRALRGRLGKKAPSAWSVGNHRRGGCRCGDEL